VIALVQEDPNLMRRPVVLIKGKPVFGYVPDEYDRI
jgi:arsenate reductase-like glutaredoxin family protein